MYVALTMLFALAMILFGAELFTNAVEWLGHKLNLGQGAVGSVLAAVGTALPETAVPVTAILFGTSHEAEEVGIGGILGAPFLLATLGSLIMAIALLAMRKHHESTQMHISERGFERDMTFFLLAYALAVVAGCIPLKSVHQIIPWLLIGLYVAFIIVTLRDKSQMTTSQGLKPLYLQYKSSTPSMFLIVLQLMIALSLIIGGAQFLTKGIEQIAQVLQMPAFVLSVLLIPLATELPETLNSVVWIRQGKDSLAIGNITGAMVFQSTLVPALGIWMTPWNLTGEAMLTGALTLAAAAFTFGMFRLEGRLVPWILLCASSLYWILPMQTFAIRYQADYIYWSFGALIGIILIVAASSRWTPHRMA